MIYINFFKKKYFEGFFILVLLTCFVFSISLTIELFRQKYSKYVFGPLCNNLNKLKKLRNY